DSQALRAPATGFGVVGTRAFATRERQRAASRYVSATTAEEGSRTPTPLRAEDFESSASASSATSASATSVAASYGTRQQARPASRLSSRMLDSRGCQRMHERATTPRRS